MCNYAYGILLFSGERGKIISIFYNLPGFCARRNLGLIKEVMIKNTIMRRISKNDDDGPFLDRLWKKVMVILARYIIQYILFYFVCKYVDI